MPPKKGGKLKIFGYLMQKHHCLGIILVVLWLRSEWPSKLQFLHNVPFISSRRIPHYHSNGSSWFWNKRTATHLLVCQNGRSKTPTEICVPCFFFKYSFCFGGSCWTSVEILLKKHCGWQQLYPSCAALAKPCTSSQMMSLQLPILSLCTLAFHHHYFWWGSGGPQVGTGHLYPP